MSTHLQKITTRAKAIRKAKPNMKWTDAVKAASKELKSKKTVGKTVGYSPARKAGFKRQTKKIQAVERKGVPHAKAVRQVVGNITLPQIGTELLKLEQKIFELKQQKKVARYVADKKAIQSQITVFSNQFKKLKEYLNTRAKFK